MTNSSSPAWEGRIFSSGWVPATGGVADVIEPSTGETLATIGMGLPEDIDRAVSSACIAQPAWVSTPFDKRAEIIREAARLLKERAAEFNEWNVRECGSTGTKAEWELHATYEQLLMAAAMPAQPDGAVFLGDVGANEYLPPCTDWCRRRPSRRGTFPFCWR